MNLTLVSSALDDLRRAKEDRICNVRQYRLADGTRCDAGELQVGQIVTVDEGQIVPCDGPLLQAADGLSSCMVSTAALNGENRWREMHVNRSLQQIEDQPEMECGLLLFGMQLHTGGPIQMLVSHTGVDTLAGRMRGKGEIKWSALDGELNVAVVVSVVIQLTLSLALAIVGQVVDLFPESFVIRTTRFILLLALLVPISLKVFQDAGKRNLSARMSAAEMNCAMIPDEFGSISLGVFDKTGTLTQNIMRIVRVDGHPEMIMAVCHSLLHFKDEDASPDEMALVHEAGRRGVQFQERQGSEITLSDGRRLKRLALLPFASA